MYPYFVFELDSVFGAGHDLDHFAEQTSFRALLFIGEYYM